MNATATETLEPLSEQHPCILCGEPGRRASMFPVQEIWDNLGHLCWFDICENHPCTPEMDERITHKLREEINGPVVPGREERIRVLSWICCDNIENLRRNLDKLGEAIGKCHGSDLRRKRMGRLWQCPNTEGLGISHDDFDWALIEDTTPGGPNRVNSRKVEFACRVLCSECRDAEVEADNEAKPIF